MINYYLMSCEQNYLYIHEKNRKMGQREAYGIWTSYLASNQTAAEKCLKVPKDVIHRILRLSTTNETKKTGVNVGAPE